MFWNNEDGIGLKNATNARIKAIRVFVAIK